MRVCSCIAPVNIAVIKYWGKRNEDLILPLNDSVSATLSTDQMHAKTTATTSAELKEDRLWLNGKEESVENPRVQRCLKELRARASQIEGSTAYWKVHIYSENNFPTAAGLASSAAGYACLVYTLARLWQVEGDLSSIARQGSGSACRSVLGGFVRWHRGELPNGEDSIATQVTADWPGMRVLIAVVSDAQKLTSSTSGMQRSVANSELLKHRVEHCVPSRVEAITKAIKERDFPTFAKITMQDSNQFHAVCLDTYPPAVYLNDTSHAIIRFVHKLNEHFGEVKVAYTFDAGPNACLYLMEQDVPQVCALMKAAFPPSPEQALDFFRGSLVESQQADPTFSVDVAGAGKVQYIIHTRVGDGPREVESHLTNPSAVN